MRSAVLVATAAALLAPSAAQAAPCETTALLGTYKFGRADVIAAGGLAAGVWNAARVRSGFAGDDLIITFVPRTERYASERQVYTAIYSEVSDPLAECQQVGADGVARQVWMSFRCRTGVAPNYTLLVR
ncbi:hypothetical protein [Couchioplanes caeruleus]|uniref:Uncharacterized protein n=2 Tax=Couchioplanes caeruleus TaxID=56438 RepID=A0A1K0FMH0_9ACTN|nr:hypothetical protein [Couchioplanes caeruleus]OJF13993.1 hypothetical protein BG844_12215 [Couchioplanes caeruleus subsp. caeruleus]ROP27938.1 hypothetical protein EDD30_0637 [Couchioplanes caeruleus]